MIKKLKASAILLIFGEILYWIFPYFSENSNNNFS